MKTAPDTPADLSAQIASELRDLIVSGALIVDARLPSEAELAEQFDVSRPTIREALKRLAAQSLIRTERGAFGGAFVNRMSYGEARAQLVTTSTLLLTMNEVDFDTACEARFALERACAPMVAARRQDSHLGVMRSEIARQRSPGLSDEAFCASDVAFHLALTDGAENPILSYHLAGAIEAMQPLMNMITYSARSRSRIIDCHEAILSAAEARDGDGIDAGLDRLQNYTSDLAHLVMTERAARKAARAASPDSSPLNQMEKPK
ncbi:GntR family transcriptional regulator [Alphaproteobacteria bacterium GH1-50]|uniref:GntR family transcriptional regulator n=1 Tax=Kangsaoukella pontilimi TaxID=2691042 RepID=A0A7C9MHW0_9RHOB|nr:GntR family transcriptional regulator [Kangsaoukella pontilimi]MXQ06435.1 GntR family transcriptional regulator [Kangsaoukella pontilimi]